METPAPVPPVEFDAPILDVFGAILKLIRVVAIFCSLLLAGAGAVLAWNFYYFVADIIQKPGETVQQWQKAMAPVIQQSPVAPLAPAFITTPAPLPPKENAAPVPPTTPAPAAPAEAAEAAEAAPASTPPAAPPLENAPETINAPTEDVPLIPGQADPDTKLVLSFADSVLDRFQAGHYSWLLGMGFLAVFCWILGKVPGVLLSAGTQVLLALLKDDKSRT